ncbi:MAG: FAD:protein FMN transferase [Planctomycetaceae bacterium]
MSFRQNPTALLVSGCLVVAAGCAKTPAPKPAAVTGRTMGTTYSVKIAGLPRSRRLADVKAEIEKLLETVNRQMSTWRTDSEISRFNAHGGAEWFPVSRDTVTNVAEAQRIGELSGGAFDVTVGPLVNLWSFGPQDRPKKAPLRAEIDAARQRVGFAKLEVRSQPPALRKSRGDVSVDLSAIAKGFGVDRVARYLDSLNVSGYMVEIGGEVRCRGTKVGGAGWQIGIQSPRKLKNAATRVVTLTDKAMATSGDYRNYFEADGRRYSHTIDPRTGRPVRHALASVSVVHDFCMTADALATTIMVLGPEDGYNFARRHKLAVLMLVKRGGGFVEKMTPEFERLFGTKP